MPGGLAPPPGPAEGGAETARSDGDLRGALLRSIGLPALVAVAIGVFFVAVFVAAFGNPRPHDLAVGVVGPDPVVQQVRQVLDQRQPGAFTVTGFRDQAAAEAAVRRRDVFGALVLGGGRPELLIAGANGQGVTQTVTQAFGPVAQQAGTQPQPRDLAPLSPDDTRGLAIFYSGFGVVLGGFLFGITSYQAAPKLLLRWRVLSLVLFAVVSGIAVGLIATVLTDALPAGFLVVTGLTGLLALATAATSATVLRLIGSAGTFVTSAGLLILGNAASTGNLPAEYLPGWMRPLADVLPPGVAVQALRGAAYFEGDSTLEAVLVLGLWSVVPIAAIGLVDAVSRRRPGG